MPWYELNLHIHNVEKPWVIDASKNFEILKNDVHQLASLTSGNEKRLWEAVKSELNEVDVKDLEYDHPLCSGILDDTSKSLTNISEDFRNIFNASSKKFLIPADETLKNICGNFVKEKESASKRVHTKFGNANFGVFLDAREKLQEMTNQMLTTLSRVWVPPN
ncbi:9894_t:CDS:2 [Dentiscutata erythropus]|uniref:9894_t:CDS:1 n=1 Tax=Dentiscutata erythropus TaxID=1348616 RepID=A0A9N8WEC0_9GLOM|nr:9894_t:CDS:2 [Dentiscutata erythropus]